MEKLLEMLGVEKLDESAQAKIKEKLDTIIEMKVKDQVNELLEAKLKEEKDKLIEEFEQKFEDYKEDITGKFSNFVDSVLEEEMVIPENVLDYAKKGELYNDLIDQFKVRLSVDEGLLSEEVKSLMTEAKEEIIKLREDMDKTIKENLELKNDAQKLAAELYLKEKMDGLTDDQKKHVGNVLSGITDKKVIDEKFEIIVESLQVSSKKDDDKVNEEDDKKSDEKKLDEEGKGSSEVKEKTITNESNGSPFDVYLKQMRGE